MNRKAIEARLSRLRLWSAASQFMRKRYAAEIQLLEMQLATHRSGEFQVAAPPRCAVARVGRQ